MGPRSGASPRARRRRAGTVGDARHGRRAAGAKLHPPPAGPAGVQPFERAHARTDDDRAEVRGRTAVLDTYRDIWTRLSALPGVSAVGGVSSLPLSQMMAWGPITVEGRTPQPGEAFINVDQRIVEHRLFPRDGDPAAAGAAVRRAGHPQRAARGRHRPADGRPAVARPGSDRPARSARRIRRQFHRAVDDRGRRGGRRQAGRARRRVAGGDVPSAPAVSDARADRRRPRRRRRRRR